MSGIEASTGFGGHLDLTHLYGDANLKPHKAKSIRTPFGRLIFTRDKGESKIFSNHQFITNTELVHRDGDGQIIEERDLGSGLVTNAGVNLMANDFNWTNATLKAANYHGLGTGTTLAAASDVFLQTQQTANIAAGGGYTMYNSFVGGQQTVVANATGTPYSPIYQTTSLFSCTGGAGIAITEWMLGVSTQTSSLALSTSTATSDSATSLTNSGAPFTASNQIMWTVETGTTTPINTPTTTPMGQVYSNTTTALTLLTSRWSTPPSQWLSLANILVSTPSGTSTYVAFPTAWDHKVFGAVTLNNGDTLQLTYQLSINSGG